MAVQKNEAIQVFRTEAESAADNDLDPYWEDKIERLSRICEEVNVRTHVAFTATAILAKATDPEVDLFAIKPEHSDSPNAFSARSLCHNVIVPLSAELGVNIGVTGREPLNNMPYFRMRSLDDGTPVRGGAKPAYDCALEIVRELVDAGPDETQKALRAFIGVRRRYQPSYAAHDPSATVTPGRLAAIVAEFVGEASENGKRAQAVVAGLMDVFAAPERVDGGRINDPSRDRPGDVCIRSAKDPDVWEKGIEVRDKPVSASDVHTFVQNCLKMETREAAIVAVSDRQEPLDIADLSTWAQGFRVGLTIFDAWPPFVDQALFWSALPKPDAASKALEFIHARLVEVEASEAAVDYWNRLSQA